MPIPLNVTVATLNNGDVLCYGRHKMQTTTTAAMRHAVFNVPNLDVVPSDDPSIPGAPVVQVAIDSPNGLGFSNAMIVVSVKITSQTDGTDTWLQIDIDSGTPNDSESPFNYWCNITVIGTPV